MQSPTMLAIADGFIDEIVDAKDMDVVEQDNTTIILGTDSVADQPPVAEIATTRVEPPGRGPEVIQKWTLSEYKVVVKAQLHSLKWR